MLGAATAVAVLWIAAAVALNLPQAVVAAGAGAALDGAFRAGRDPAPAGCDERAGRYRSVPPDHRPRRSFAGARPGGAGTREVALGEPSVVKVHSLACGIGYAGSGWVVASKPELVVTAAHVVAGSSEIDVQAQGQRELRARVVAFDGHNDLALLAVPGLTVKPLPLASPRANDSAAVLGYPGDGPFKAAAARVGSTATIFSPDYSGQIVSRSITSLRGKVRPGDSGGAVVNGKGQVELTVFGARKGTDVGYGTSTDLVRELLEQAHRLQRRLHRRLLEVKNLSSACSTLRSSVAICGLFCGQASQVRRSSTKR